MDFLDGDLSTLATPALILDQAKFGRNVERMKSRAHALGVRLRPHLKTVKSVELARAMMMTEQGPCTVSTLREAEQYAAEGVRDILYGVGLAPHKLSRVLSLRRAGANVSILVDALDHAKAIANLGSAARSLPVFIEIDSDGHRGGIRPNDPVLLSVARELVKSGADLRGVLTHAGESYACRSVQALRKIADQERDCALFAAKVLIDSGLPCPVISVGSTPTALAARDLRGVTELRAGVFAFFDLVMAGIGVCHLHQIAISVLATVIGAQPERHRFFIDAGWMALSQDRGTASQQIDHGYGIVCDVNGDPFEDLIVAEATQEHGVVQLRAQSSAALPELEIGTMVRILPNHACATASQHDTYMVVAEGSTEVKGRISRFRGW